MCLSFFNSPPHLARSLKSSHGSTTVNSKPIPTVGGVGAGDGGPLQLQHVDERLIAGVWQRSWEERLEGVL